MTVDAAHGTSPLRRGDPRSVGRYRLLSRLGSGGMGVVYLGRADEGPLVAVKLVHAHLAGDDEFRRRFRSEIARARQVPPFCTAEVLDADLDDEHPYLVVEYVDGPSLADVVEERGPLSPANLHSVAIGVATALTAIHGAGVIHRDLKPRNVLLAPGTPKVIDFGIARALEPTSQHTRTDQMVGTVAYMAPERFDSAPGTPLTPAADVFAWGVVVAYAGTGRTPFNGDSPPATAARILTQAPDLSGLSGPLLGLVELALAKDPAERPTARELLDMLLSTGQQHTPQLAEALNQQPALRTAASDARELHGTGGRAAGPVAPAPRCGTCTDGSCGSCRARRQRTSGGADPDRAGPDRFEPALVAGPPQPPGARDISPGRAAHVRRRSRWRTAGVVLAVLLVICGVGLIGSHYLFTLSDGLEPAEQAYDSVSVPEPVVEGDSVIQDPLNEPGQFSDSSISGERSNCVIDGVMRATLARRGVYQCAGPRKLLPLESTVTVTTRLETPGSCAAVWLRWNGEAGYQVRLCADAAYVALDRPDDKRVLDRLPLPESLEIDQSTEFRIVARADTAEVIQDGTSVGSVELAEDDLDEGQVLLGISVDAVDLQPPYRVSFANLDIRTVTG
jgi:predicted Ser/Thr protein kinase